MRKLMILFILSGALTSCLVTTAPWNHYFVATNNIEKESIKVKIFSTPRYKDYVVTNIDSNAQVFIKSPVFDDSTKFYLMYNEHFFQENAKKYRIAKGDRKYYRTEDYKNITLKIISQGGEKVSDYSIVDYQKPRPKFLF